MTDALTCDRAVPPGARRVLPWPLTVLLGALFMNLLDATIVNVAAQHIRVDLNADGAQLQLVVSGYIPTYGVLLITGARIGDRHGHARVFRAGIVGFTVASALCGLAPTAGTLIAARLAQGAGAAAMMPQVMSLIQRIYEGPARIRALAWYGAVLALGSVLGQILGGVLLAADPFGLGWRVVFLVNVPVGVVLAVAAARVLPADRGNRDRGMDLPGVVSLGAFVALLTVPLVLGHELGWTGWLRLCLGLAVPALVVVVVVERRAWRGDRSPILPADVLRTPGLVPGLAVITLGLAIYSGYLLSLSLHLQAGLGLSALATGLSFVPLSIGFAAGSLSIPRMPERLPARLVPVGLLLSGTSYGVLGLITRGGARPGLAFYGDLVLVGLGSAFAVTPVIGLCLRQIPLTRAADAGGMLTTAFQLGQVLRVAIIGSFFLGRVEGGSPSATAFGQTCWILVAASVAAVASAVVLVRTTRHR